MSIKKVLYHSIRNIKHHHHCQHEPSNFVRNIFTSRRVVHLHFYFYLRPRCYKEVPLSHMICTWVVRRIEGGCGCFDQWYTPQMSIFWGKGKYIRKGIGIGIKFKGIGCNLGSSCQNKVLFNPFSLLLLKTKEMYSCHCPEMPSP